MTERSNIRSAALDWLVQTSDPEFEQWDAFTGWLEASPLHADAFHSLAQDQSEMLPLVAAIEPRTEEKVVGLARPRVALAASVAAAVAATGLYVIPHLQPISHATSPGQRAIVALGGGDQLVLNGGTRISLTGWTHRTVRLAQGQILLKLHEQSRDKVEVKSGDLELMDIGTVFEVARDGPLTRVVVSQGNVVADPEGAHLMIEAGQRLSAEDGASELVAVPAGEVQAGAFMQGQLSYADDSVATVIADLRRSTGLDLVADPTIGALRFSGTLSVAAVKHDPQSLAPLLGVSVEPTQSGWKFTRKVQRSGG